MWHQRSRMKWLHDGDRNTSYYHMKATGRKSRNRIQMLRGHDSVWVEEGERPKGMVSQFFQKLFKEEPSGLPKPVLTKLSDQDIAHLSKDTEKDEINDTLFGMKSWKASGPMVFLWGFITLIGI